MQLLVVRPLIGACLLVLTASPALAQLIPGWDAKQFTIEQLDADRIKLVREVEVVGVGPNAGQQIFADELEWNLRTGEFVATGNVLLVTPTSRLSAARVVFNTKTQRGTFETASGMASLGTQGQKDRSMFGTLEPVVYFYGEQIEKIGPDRYRITKGGFTTCVQPTPRWDVVSNKATIDLGDYAILKNAVLRVKDVPVFYMPVLYYPIQDDDRATGFLLPTYGASTYRGQSLSNAFFWAINRSHDATFFHDWFMSRGQGGGAEYRYVLAPGADGSVRSYWLNEKPLVTTSVPGSTTPPQAARKNYRLEARLVQPLPAKLMARANVDYFSDLVTQQRYNYNIYDATLSQRTLSGGVTGSWGRVNLTASYNRSEIFSSQTTSQTSGTAPGVNISFGSTRIREWPLYFAMNSDAARTVYINRSTAGGRPVTEDFGLGRVDVFPSLRSPLTKWPFLTINASLAFRTTYFSESLERLARPDGTRLQVPIGLWRRYGDVRVDLIGPVFSKVFSPQNAFAERLKHLIEPNLSIQRITKVENQEFVPRTGSAYDLVVGDTTRVTYGLTNRMMIRKPPPPSTVEPATTSGGAPREFLSVSISQSYYTNPRASQIDQSVLSSYYRQQSNFSPIILDARSAPTELSTMRVVAEYDASKGELQALSASAGVNYRRVQARGGLSNRLFGQGRTNSLDANTTFTLFDARLGGTYSMNWDITRGQILQQRWIGNYNAQCCGVAIEYQEVAFGLNPVIPKDRRFNLSFTLAGIGSFSNFFGAFGAAGARRY